MQSKTAREVSESHEEDKPWENFLAQWGKSILFTLIASTAFIFLANLLLSKQKERNKVVYGQAEELFLNFERDKTNTAVLKELEKTIDGEVNLESKYEARLAQMLINQGQIEQAQKFISDVKQRTGLDDKYAAYVDASIAIEEKRYDQALEKSLLLRAALENSELFSKTKEEELPFGQQLYASNLLRLAFLYQSLNKQAKELEVWESILSSKGNSKDSPRLARAMQEQFDSFKEGDISLFDYIKARKTQLDK